MARPTTVAGAILIAGLSALAACGGSDSAAEDLQSSMQTLTEQIDALIGHATCEMTAQCRVIAVGAKPCGGPAQYRAYSTLGTDVAALETAVARFTELSAAWNRETGAISDCAFVTPPPVACASGRCVAQ